MIKIFSGKGGVSKSTTACWYALQEASKGVNVHLLGLDYNNSILEPFNIQPEVKLKKSHPYNPEINEFPYLKPLITESINDDKWVNLWTNKPWTDYKEETKGLGDLYLKKIIPNHERIKDFKRLKDGIKNQLYTRYEIKAGKEIRQDHELLMIDTDSLEGLQRLLNYFNEYPDLKSKLITEGELMFVTTLEEASLEKVNKMLNEPIIQDYQVKELCLSFVEKKDPRLEGVQFYYNLKDLKQKLLYAQSREPLGLGLLDLNKPQVFTKPSPISNPSNLPLVNVYLMVGKGGQGKSTMACSLAVNLAERGGSVYLINADARTSLDSILGEYIGVEKENDSLFNLGSTEQYKGLNISVLKDNPYLDDLPGAALMKALMRVGARKGNNGLFLIIDTPPTSNLAKSLELGVPSKRSRHMRPGFKRAGYDLFWDEVISGVHYLNKHRSNTYEFLRDQRVAYAQGLEVLQTVHSMAIPVLQPTISALKETNQVISLLNDYWIKPYQPYWFEQVKPLIVNKAVNNETLGEIRDSFPETDYDLIMVPPVSDLISCRERLSEIGWYLNPK